MKRFGLGLREYVSLAVLALVVIVAAQFLDPSASESSRPDRAGTAPLGTPTPQPPPRALAAPSSWSLTFTNGGFGQPPDQVQSENLALTVPRAPFPDYRDNHWQVVAAAQVPVSSGRWTFRIQHACDVRVLVDGEQVAAEGPGGTKVLTVVFFHDEGTATITIEANDVDGPFELDWAE